MMSGEKIRVGVLRGGLGPEYNVSLETGSYVLAHISRNKYRPIDILVDRDGVWHQNGIPMSPDDLQNYVDVVFNCLHGLDGEDGRIQKFLESKNIPFVGSDNLSSAITGNKKVAKERLKAVGFKTPRYVVLQNLGKFVDEKDKLNHIRRKAMEVFKKLPGSWIVKPILGSASTHTYLVTTFAELVSILHYLADLFDEILIEEYIEGKEVVSAILEGYRNEKQYTVTPHEVVSRNGVPKDGPKPMGLHRAYIVGKDDRNKSTIENMTREIHREFGLSDFSLVEYIVSNKGDIYVIEIDSVPILSSDMPLHTLLESAGISQEDFIDHLISRNHKVD
jgi:D-alanine-D-alanine ligase